MPSADFALPVEGELAVAGPHRTAGSAPSFFLSSSSDRASRRVGVLVREGAILAALVVIVEGWRAWAAGLCFGHCGGSSERRSGSPRGPARVAPALAGARRGRRHGGRLRRNACPARGRLYLHARHL